jgi:predicted metallopeptidase
MNKWSLLAFLTLLTACGSFPDPRGQVGIAPSLKPYVADFEAYYGVTVSSSVNFVKSLPNRRLAQCRVWTAKKGIQPFVTTKTFTEVEVLENKWIYMSTQSRLALIYHELIHCEFKIPYHIEDLRPDGCPQNLMFSMLTVPYCLDKYWESYRSYWR